MGRYRHRPLHLFGGLGLVLGFLGTVLLGYLTVLKVMGEAIGHRPLCSSWACCSWSSAFSSSRSG